MTSPRPRILPFPAHDARRLSVESFVDPRTITAYFLGKNVRPTIAARLQAALVRLGLPDRTPEATAPSSPEASEPAPSPERRHPGIALVP